MPSARVSFVLVMLLVTGCASSSSTGVAVEPADAHQPPDANTAADAVMPAAGGPPGSVAGNGGSSDAAARDRAGPIEGGRTFTAVIDETDFTLWVPDEPRVLRFVAVETDGTRPLQAPWPAAAVAMKLRDDKRVQRPRILSRVLEVGLEQLAGPSGHPELANLPFVISGFSKGASFAHGIATILPQRTIAYAAVEGGFPSDDKRVPGLFLVGEKSPFPYYKSLPTSYEPLRRKGAPWALAVQWGIEHDFRNGSHIIAAYFQHMAAVRLPADPAAALEGRVPLRDLREIDGWIGDHSTWPSHEPVVSAPGEFQGETGQTSWLPDAYMAAVWRAFAARSRRVNLVAVPENHLRATIMRSSSTIHASAKQTGVSGPAMLTVAYFDGDRQVGQGGPDHALPGLRFEPGIHALRLEATFADGVKAVSMPRMHLVFP